MTQAADPIDIDEPAILLRLKQTYRPDMSPGELYDATRGDWTVGARRAGAHYAFAVYDGIIREVYRIDRWSAVTAASGDSDARARKHDRWQFNGEPAEENMRSRYRGRSIAHYFSRGARSSFRYVNC
jgi:uncharacterized protein